MKRPLHRRQDCIIPSGRRSLRRMTCVTTSQSCWVYPLCMALLTIDGQRASTLCWQNRRETPKYIWTDWLDSLKPTSTPRWNGTTRSRSWGMPRALASTRINGAGVQTGRLRCVLRENCCYGNMLGMPGKQRRHSSETCPLVSIEYIPVSRLWFLKSLECPNLSVNVEHKRSKIWNVLYEQLQVLRRHPNGRRMEISHCPERYRGKEISWLCGHCNHTRCWKHTMLSVPVWF